VTNLKSLLFVLNLTYFVHSAALIYFTLYSAETYTRCNIMQDPNSQTILWTIFKTILGVTTIL